MVQGGNSTAGGGGGGHDSPRGPAEELDERLSNYLLVVLGAISVLLIGWRLTTVLIKYIRTISGLNNDTQRYFAKASEKMSWIKRNLLYAPIFSKRHNREFQLSTAVNVGTLPTRFQLFFLLGYLATNVAFCVINIDYSAPLGQVCSLIISRTGTLSVVNMIPLFILAGRNNPLIKLLGISFDTMNLIHRWLGRIVVLEALAHTFAFLVKSAANKGWDGAFATVFRVPYMQWGFVVSI